MTAPLKLAPQVGLEPTTYRLTAGCSAIELLRNKIDSGSDLLSRGSCPSTIGAGGLNFRVRDGNGCGPSAIATRKLYPQNWTVDHISSKMRL